ncbi:MAG TPA: DEAD/DEAH box helicase [Streptosporangiaceae bacterium]|nr:DEAD/DEAH box helicase [Streptosporangiaceae bacterium]
MQDDPEAVEPPASDLPATTDGPVTGDTASDDAASTTTPVVTPKTFRDLGIAEPICAALEAEGITTAFPIQALTLPVALSGHDLIGQARTGTGKTLAFGIPILERLDDMPGGGTPASPRALVVVPTRELAVQVAEDVRVAGSRMGAKVVVLYGGRAYEPQIEALASVDVVVGTPGRLLDLTRQGHLKLGQVRVLVLDEADKMLDLGFLPDVEKILGLTPRDRQSMLFSATMPGEVVTLARRHLSRPMHIRAEHSDEPALVPSTQQFVYRAHQMDKVEVLSRILQADGRGLCMVFVRTKRAADQVSGALSTRGFAAAAVHGDLGQGQRERAMRAFRSGKVDVLVATDVAARGIDVDDVTHVVNYECPEDEKAYLHRIGRTGRAGRAGVAVTFVDWNDMPRWKVISDTLNLGHPEPVETYSTSEHLYTDLQIPAAATGTLPRAQRERAGLEAEELEDIGETGRNRSRRGQPGRGRPGQGGRRGDHGPDGEPRQRRERVRRRTRGGVQVSGSGHGGAEHGTAAQGGSAPGGQGKSQQAATRRSGGEQVAAGEAGSDSGAQARRRRRRSSRGHGGHGSAAAGNGTAE